MTTITINGNDTIYDTKNEYYYLFDGDDVLETTIYVKLNL